MNKLLRLDVDRLSWGNAPEEYKKSCPFSIVAGETRVDFLGALLLLGMTSVSIRIPSWCMASQWAILRYVGAADPRSERLRLDPATEDLDTHHVRVLSDDWGVGISLRWLSKELGYKYVLHAASAMQVLQSAGIARFVQRKKTGPFKCPDFLAFDMQNKIHLVECKGNTEKPAHIDEQFKRGEQQKRNIRFANESLVAQRLLTGVAIARPQSVWESTLKIADPSADHELSHYYIQAKTASPIVHEVKKAIIARGLISAGALKTAHNLFPKETSTDASTVIDQRIVGFEARGERWEGLVFEMRFPVHVELHDQTSVSGCRMRYGVREELLEAWSAPQVTSKQRDLVKGADVELKLEDDSQELKEGQSGRAIRRIKRHSTIRLGTSFLGDLELLEK